MRAEFLNCRPQVGGDGEAAADGRKCGGGSACPSPKFWPTAESTAYNNISNR